MRHEEETGHRNRNLIDRALCCFVELRSFRVVSVFLLVLAGAGLVGCGDNLATAQEKLRSADSPLVRAAAAQRLGEIGGDEAIRSLTLYGLRDITPTVRAASAKALSGKDHPQVIDLLGDLLLDPNEDVQRAVASALAEAKNEKARRYLELGYSRTGSAGRAIIGQALLTAGASPRRIVEEMTERRLRRSLDALERGSQAERIGALHELGRCARADAVTALLSSLQHPSIPVAAAAAAALGDTGTREAVPALLELLEEPHPALRRDVIDALGRIGDPMAAGAMAELALTEDGQTALFAIRALVRLDRDEQVRGALCRLGMESTNPQVLAVATRELVESYHLSECDLADRLASDLGGNEESLRNALIIVAEAKDTLASEEERSIVEELVTHDDLGLRIEALRAATQLGMKDLGERILEDLKAEKQADEIARERWIGKTLPASFGWGDDGSDLSSQHHHGADHAEIESLMGTDRRRQRFDELMNRVAAYRAEMQAHRRATQGYDEADPEEMRARHREALFAQPAHARVTLLPGVHFKRIELLAALTRTAASLAKESSLEVLATLIEHPEPKVGRAAIEALAALDSPEADSLLATAFEGGRNAEILALMATRLARSGHGKPLLLAASRWEEPEALREIIRGLALIGDQKSVEAIAGFLDSALAPEAVRALVGIGGEVAARELLEHLNQVDPPGAAYVLEHPPDDIPLDELVALARRLLHSDWPELRAAAARYLRGEGVADPWLEAVRSDFEATVRQAAAS